jgi:hypothetical protein
LIFSLFLFLPKIKVNIVLHQDHVGLGNVFVNQNLKGGNDDIGGGFSGSHGNFGVEHGQF